MGVFKSTVKSGGGGEAEGLKLVPDFSGLARSGKQRSFQSLLNS